MPCSLKKSRLGVICSRLSGEIISDLVHSASWTGMNCAVRGQALCPRNGSPRTSAKQPTASTQRCCQQAWNLFQPGLERLPECSCTHPEDSCSRAPEKTTSPSLHAAGKVDHVHMTELRCQTVGVAFGTRGKMMNLKHEQFCLQRKWI